MNKKVIQIPLSENEYALVQTACALYISETGTPVSVTRYALNILWEDVRKRTKDITED